MRYLAVITLVVPLLVGCSDRPDRAAIAANSIAECRNKRDSSEGCACFGKIVLELTSCEFLAGEELLLREEGEDEKARRVRALAKGEEGCDMALFEVR